MGALPTLRHSLSLLLAVVRLSGVVGAIVGFAISVVLTEVIFPNKQEWPIVINAALTVAGALAGTAVGRNLITQHAASSAPQQDA